MGLRVKRGPDWEWRDQDDGGLGITVDIEARSGWVAVRWDHGVENKYRVGADGKYLSSMRVQVFQNILSDPSC